jgi:hypothetical protein
MIRLLFYVFTVISCVSVSVGCKVKKPIVNLNDSLSVTDFINKSTICNKILFVEKNKHAFCSELGYSNLILSSISKGTNAKIFIPYYSGGVRLTNKDQELYLQESLDEFKKIFDCK